MFPSQFSENIRKMVWFRGLLAQVSANDVAMLLLIVSPTVSCTLARIMLLKQGSGTTLVDPKTDLGLATREFHSSNSGN